MNPKFYILLTSFLSICSWAGFVDDYNIEDLKKKYSDDMGVYAQHNQIVNISVDEVTGEFRSPVRFAQARRAEHCNR